MPALDALVSRLHAANVQPLGISVDSRHCHLNWGLSLGGVSFPLLQDFHPKGEVGTKYGMYIDQGGITDRATVFIDAGGTVRYAASVTPGGERDIPKLVDELIDLAGHYDGELEGPPDAAHLPDGTRLFVKSNCGFSRAALAARDNLHLDHKLPTVNVSDDEQAMAELRELTGKEQAPCLVVDGKPLLESDDIIKELVTRTTGFW